VDEVGFALIHETEEGHKLVDYHKQQKFTELAESLKGSLQAKYGCEFDFFQKYIANRFNVYSRQPANPYYEVTFTNEERLEVAVGDGRVAPFKVDADLSDGRTGGLRNFDTAAIWSTLDRLLDIATPIYYLIHETKEGHKLVDYNKFAKFAEWLKDSLQAKYGCEFDFWQSDDAKRFDFHSKRPAKPCYAGILAYDKLLRLFVGNGTYWGPFRADVDLSYCSTFLSNFDSAAIWSTLDRLLDIGTAIYVEYEQRLENWRSGR
jgi:hypothetical protein